MLSLRCVTSFAGLASLVAATFDYDAISLREVGARNTLDWRIWMEKDGEPISPWHDIPLYPDPDDHSIINFYVEIPRWTDGKVETKRDEPLNPIFHDDKDDKPRYVQSVWPHRSYPFNYGSIPQTWEDSTKEQEYTGYIGDNDPVDIIDISGIEPAHVGQIKRVKVLGALAMIDDNTTDWKVVTIDVKDPLADLVDTVEDLDAYRPGLRQQFYDWFLYYKVARGDGLNTIVGEDYVNATFAQEVIKESHGYWKDLVRGKTQIEDISIWQTATKRYKKSYIPSDDATKKFDLPKKSHVKKPKARPIEYDYWYYLDEDFQLIELPGQ